MIVQFDIPNPVIADLQEIAKGLGYGNARELIIAKIHQLVKEHRVATIRASAERTAEEGLVIS